MNEQYADNKFKQRMEDRWGRRPHNGRRWVGVFLLIIGAFFLARAGGVLFPGWFFTWPMILITVGLFSGFRHGFRGIGWLIPILIGGVFLMDKVSPELRIKPYLWPIVLITLGLVFIFRPKSSPWLQDGGGESGGGADSHQRNNDPATGGFDGQPAAIDRSDKLDVTSIFSGVKKNILSKNFRGGDITTFMGGAEINLLQADFNGRAVIDCANLFGGTKLIVPADWDVQSGMVTIFGGIEDKRQPSAHVNPNKVLYLDGTCIFGGVDIKSF